ncbi:g4544 [Coccomyxa viridis]|uniref:G4544 protein n=1 Tax=Coccomyxa viridis TaxID=1274662 RepID=A0ABP1FXG3_9CHLO
MAHLVGVNKLIYTFFCEARHDAQGGGSLEGVPELGIVSKWRQKERLKTTAVALVLCLNIGVDPPDVIKISPCARLECWVDPLSMQPPKALETIGKNLQAQYERWQPRAKYKTHLDPTMDDVKKLAISCRRTAKNERVLFHYNGHGVQQPNERVLFHYNGHGVQQPVQRGAASRSLMLANSLRHNERVLFHYNGHGVPRPTANGEIWVFNKSYTQYIPMSVYDLQAWVGSPAIYAFDCSAAGLIINSFRAFAEQRTQEAEALGSGYMGSVGREGENLMKEVILLAACGAGEVLPQSPDLPADVFTACLTTPIKVALRWFCSRSLLKAEGLTKELIDRIPGKQTDRKTPLGELNWIFTAITDSIAWNMLPRSLFQRLFRQDLLVASLFRNFLLADRIMRAASCTPASFPRLPSTHQHPMWQAWDMAAEMCLLQLPALLSGEPDAQFLPSPFFAEQLTAFELWLAHGSSLKQPPEQLPIVLLSQVHRLRALVLLGRFLDMGSWAVDLALSVGIFPYVLKLLQTTASDLRTTLILIWTKILALDKSCQADLVKDGGHHYFISSLDVNEPGMSPDSRAQAAFVLAVICDGHKRGRLVCGEQGLLQKLLSLLSNMAGGATTQAVQGVSQAASSPLLVKWLCLCLGRLVEDQPELLSQVTGDALVLLSRLLHATHPEVRAAAVFALSICIQIGKPEIEWNSGNPGSADERARVEKEREIACYLLQAVYDASPLVRAEVAVGLARLAESHSVLFQDAVHDKMLNTSRVLKGDPAQPAQLHPAGASPPQAARSAPQEAGPGGRQLARLSSSHGASAAQPERQAGQKHDEPEAASARSLSGKGLAKPKSQANFASLASPGVRRMSSDTFEASIKVGPASRSPPSPTTQHLAASEAGSPQSMQSASNGTVYASADAARVGGGLYSHLLDAAITLATDPASVVASTGAQLLRVAGVELVESDFLPVSGSTPLPANASPSKVMSASYMRTSYSASGSSVGPTAEAASSGSGSSKWRSSWRSSASVGGRQLAASASTSPQSPPFQPQFMEACSRRQYTLKPVQANGHHASDPSVLLSRATAPASVGSRAASPAASLASASSMLTSGSTAQQQPPLPKIVKQQQENGMSASQSSEQSTGLPTSLVYRMSCEHFSRPLLEQQQMPGHTGKLHFASGSASDSVFGTHDPMRTANRVQERDEKCQACAAVGRNAKLKEQVTTIDFQARSVAALLHHPFRPILVGVDGRGTVKVYSHRHSAFVNSFHLADDKWPMSVVNMWQLNELQAGLLMVAAADGSVRVWRDYTYRGSQRLATAWQAVPLGTSSAAPAGDGAHSPSTYEWSEQLSDGTLLAVGGGAPSTVHLWNLQQEICIEQIPIEDRGPAALPKTVVKRLAVSRHHPLMVATTSAGSVLLYDLRAPRGAVAQLKPHSSPMVGMAVEPGGLKDQLVTAAADGELKFIDFRVLGEGNTAGSSGESAFAMRPPSNSGSGTSGTLGVWKTVSASPNSRNLSALVAHPNAPLLATGTASQVVKLWSALGEQLGVIRATTSLLDSRRPGPVNTLAFHPYQLSLASGGGDTIVNLYSVKTGIVPDRAMSVPLR